MSPRPTPVILALALAVPSWAQTEVGLRDQLEGFGAALDRAVQAVSRPGTLHVLSGEHTSRGFYLKGYGAVFTLPPRALPPAQPPRPLLSSRSQASGSLVRALQDVEGSLDQDDSEPIRQLLESRLQELGASDTAASDPTGANGTVPPPTPPDWAALRARLEARAQIERQRDQQLRTLEAQIEAFQRDAERMREQAERHMDELRRQIKTRDVSAQKPAPPSSPSPSPPATLLPAPPWSFWVEVSSEAEAQPRSQEDVVQNVRAAVTRVVEKEGGRLAMLAPEESVVVAVDFVPSDVFVPRLRPERTLVVRVKKKEIDAHRAGRLSTEELGRRLEIIQY
jgi:hypothetical protein